MKNASAPTQFATDWTETYGYEAERNYLTSFSTTDGIAGASKTWSYDAAGNRNDATAVDNLNRLTAMSTTNYTNDILGNRLTRTYSNGREATTTWDCLNRMLSYKYYTNTVTTYDYRADGMRTHKAKATTHNYYRYDGQMGIQDVEVKPGVLNITNYGLGARGVDIGSTNGDVWYPVYDGHGNMVATLSKSGSGYNVSNRRSYSPWGDLRMGTTYTDPTGRYCANLGHKTDDESAMIYMRARYYEPSVGRFISQDRAREGTNYYVYCHNNPIRLQDPTGCGPIMDLLEWFVAILRTYSDPQEGLYLIGDCEAAEEVAYRDLILKALEYETQAEAAKATAMNGASIDAGERDRVIQFLTDSAAECRMTAKVERLLFNAAMKEERIILEIELENYQ